MNEVGYVLMLKRQKEAEGRKRRNEMTIELLESESVFSEVTEEQIDREQGLIRNVKLLGLRSKNRRNYDTPGVRKEAGKVLEGARIYIDHPPTATTPRSYRDKIAVVEGAVTYRPGAGHFGTIRYNPKHPLAEQFLWDVKNAPRSFGMSINASVKMGKTDSSGDTAVESIDLVRSIDIVTNPATAEGLFESEQLEEEEIMDLKTLREKHPELVKQLVTESQSDATEQAELAAAKKEAADLKTRLEALESERQAEKLRADVSAEIGKIFEGVKIEKALLDEIVECACEQTDRTKFKSVLSKISPMLVEVDDEEEVDDTEPVVKTAKEQVEDTPAPRQKKSKSGTLNLKAELGIV
jgi:hypothetical protein